MASSAPHGAGPSEAHINRGQWGWAKRSVYKSGATGLGWRAVMPCGTVAPVRTDQAKRIQITGRRGGVAWGTCFRASSMTGQGEAYINRVAVVEGKAKRTYLKGRRGGKRDGRADNGDRIDRCCVPVRVGAIRPLVRAHHPWKGCPGFR